MRITLQQTSNGQAYAIKFERYRKPLIDKLKTDILVPGRLYDARTLSWLIPASPQSKKLIERFSYYVKHFEAVEWADGSHAGEEEIPQEYTIAPLPSLTVSHNLKISPYEYQKQGIARGLQLKRFINGDDMGLGKTFQSIATITIADAFPCLVICPNVVKINWQREWSKFTDKKAMVLTDSVRTSFPFFWQTGMNQVFIVNYESLKKYFVRRIGKKERWTLRDVEFNDNIKMFKSIIIDEAHKVKSASTQQSKFCKGIAQGKEYVIMLTGTPVVNKPKDLIAQASIMDRLTDLGGYKFFTQRYCSGPNEASNLKELNARLWEHCFFRREKKEVLNELPEMTRQILTVDISNRKEYNDAEQDLIGYLTQYKQADDAKIASALRGEVMVRLGILRDVTARGKLKEVVEFVNDFLNSGKKLVIFCNLHAIVDELLKKYPTAVCITGRQSISEKQESIDSFVNNPNTKIVICSIKAASAGVDGLQKVCSDVLFIEEPWTAADRDQAESRVHRNGLRNGATMYHMLGRDTVDIKMWRIIEEKAKISSAVMGGKDEVQTNIVDMMARMFENGDNDE